MRRMPHGVDKVKGFGDSFISILDVLNEKKYIKIRILKFGERKNGCNGSRIDAEPS